MTGEREMRKEPPGRKEVKSCHTWSCVLLVLVVLFACFSTIGCLG